MLFFFSKWLVFKRTQTLCSYIKTDKHHLFGYSLLKSKFCSLNISVLKLTYWDANNALSFPLSHLTFLRKYKVWQGIFVSHFPAQLLPREKKKIFNLLLFSGDHALFGRGNTVILRAPASPTWAHSSQAADTTRTANSQRGVTPVINLLNKSYWGRLQAQGRTGSFPMENLSYSGCCSNGPFSEHSALPIEGKRRKRIKALGRGRAWDSAV